jgi:hypothetical protein
MFKHAPVRILIVSIGLSITGLAAAHNPPSLVERQAASEQATQSSAGYRDMHARFGEVTALAPRVLKAAGGYRDIAYRFPSIRPRMLVANAK